MADSLADDAADKNAPGLDWADARNWVSPDVGVLDKDARKKFLARKKGILLYQSGYRDPELKNECGFGERQIRRLVKDRCLTTHPDGRPYGWRALIPHLQLAGHARTKAIEADSSGYGTKGALAKLLRDEPEIRDAFVARILGSRSKNQLAELNVTKARHAEWLKSRLRGKNYEADGKWPFTVAEEGYRSICKFIDTILASNLIVAVEIAGGADAVAKLKSGDGTQRPVYRFLQRVEMDSHKLDGIFTVRMPNTTGGYQERIIHRLWVTCIIEVISRVALAYRLSFGREVSSQDVLLTLKKALLPWNRIPHHFAPETYRANAGFLSTLGDEFVGLCWDETSVDGALALSSGSVQEVLHDVVQSSILRPRDFNGRAVSKDNRPFIERFFGTIERDGLQRLPNTTGANIGQRKGRNPEKVALKHSFQYESLSELLDVLIANYNATPHSSIDNQTPLQYAERLYAAQKENMRQADPILVEDLCSFRKECVVRGGASVGRQPYIQFAYGTYTSEVLHNASGLVGKKIWISLNNEDDIRTIKASLADGTPLGRLRVGAPWHRTPHSLLVRQSIGQTRSKNRRLFDTERDPIEAYMRMVESRKSKLPVSAAYLAERKILDAAWAPRENGTAPENGPNWADPVSSRRRARAEQEDAIEGEVKKGSLPPRRIARAE